MTDMRIRNRKSIRYGVNKRHGFTLAEVLVVVAIIAILAAVGVATAIGFINKSRFDQNSQNAVTVYQTAQTAIAHKVDDGTIEAWINDTFGTRGFTDADLFDEHNNEILDETNKSIHKTVTLTFNPGREHADSDSLYSLLSGYFYDATMFAGSMSVEFDISATKQSDGTIGYSATVLSAFYSKENKAPSADLGGGWDKTRTNKTDVNPAYLPYTDYNYRRYTSFAGYYNGSKESIVGPVPVALPGEDQADLVIFTLRNGETLDVTWAVPQNTSHNGNFKITLTDVDDPTATVDLEIDEQKILYSWNNTEAQPITYNNNVPQFVNGTYVDESKVSYEQIMYEYDIMQIKKTSVEALAVVTCSGVEYTIPLTVSWVEGDKREGLPELGYNSYTLSIDCMMIRADYASSVDQAQSFSISRFFGNTPRNISATLTGTASGVTINEEATRAIDDPIYCTKVDMLTWAEGSLSYSRPTYFYTVAGRGALDTDEHCVVNTLFGDDIFNGGVINGTSYNASGELTAVISSFRHLSNIRMIPDGQKADYSIIRDLNWYTKVGTGHYVSDVKEYKRHSDNDGNRSLAGYSATQLSQSPVSGGNVKIVAFPAIPNLYANQTLTAMPKSGQTGMSYSINNVQMRLRSFAGDVDTAYGLICENDGSVYNVTTNNLSLVIYDVPNGSASDYSGGDYRRTIMPTSDVTIREAKISQDVNGMRIKNAPIGGLIGLNKGSLGADSSTVRMNNTVVMAGDYWMIMWYNQGVGGVVGRNEGSTAGSIEMNGSFAVLGQNYVGGIIGYSNGNIGASLYINNPDYLNNPDTEAPDNEFEFPVESRTNKKISCVVASKYACGGAIGFVQNSDFTAISESERFNSNNVNPDTGEITFSGPYQISVNLPANSLVLSVCDTNQDRFTGGVIGYMKNCKGYVSIDLDNQGDVILHDIDRAKVSYCGGVIGYEDNCSSTLVINAQYGSNSRIGSFSDSDSREVLPDSTGGAIGFITNHHKDRIIAVKITNGAVISARSNKDSCGAGGAIGGIIANNGFNNIYLDVTNSGGIYSKSTDTDSATNGTGGAIGCLNSNNGKLSANTIIRVINSGTISGGFHVGGAIGYSKMNNDKLFVQSTGPINGLDYVGGAVGYNANEINSVYTKLLSGSSVKGNNFTSGAIGYSFDTVGTITVEATDSSITGEYYTGGAVGYNEGSITSISASISSTVVKGAFHAAGAIGINRNTVGTITVDAADSSITGQVYTAGAVGNNYASITGISVTFSNTDLKGSNYTAGAVGYNEKAIGTVTAGMSSSTVDGEIYTAGGVAYNKGSITSIGVTASDTTIDGNSYTAGGIGFNIAAIDSVTAKMSSSSNITGKDYTAGGIGFNNVSIATIDVEFADSSKLSGDDYVGGAVGHAEKGTYTSVTVAYSGSGSEPVIQCVSCSGGVFGQLGSESSGASAASINCTISAGYFIQQKSGTVAYSDDAYVGGLIGWICSESSVDSIKLEGSGGTVDPSKADVMLDSKNYPKTYMVAAGGNSVGGMIGQIGSAQDNNQIVIPTIDTTSGPNICVVSTTEDSSGIGGWVGKSYGCWAGLGSGDESSLSTYNVTNVYGVYGKGNEVGAFCGRLDGEGGDSKKVYANIAVDISYTTIIGKGYTGGLVGRMNQINYFSLKSVNMTGLYVKGTINVGGLIGLADECKIENQMFNGNISGASSVSVTGTEDVGGFIGEYCCTSDTDFNMGDISVTASTFVIAGQNNVGGVIGHVVLGNATLLGNTTLKLSYNSSITATGDNVGTAFGEWASGNLTDGITISLASGSAVSGLNRVGGAIGNWTSGNLENGINVTISNSAIIGGNYVAGAVGYWYGASFKGGITLDATNSKIQGSTYVGGALSRFSTGNFEGGMTINYSGTKVTGIEEVGGAIGTMDGGYFSGGMTINFTNKSYLGDDPTLPESEWMCIEAGGAVAYLGAYNGFVWNSGSICIEIDGTSQIFAGGLFDGSVVTYEESGVGGAFGRLGTREGKLLPSLMTHGDDVNLDNDKDFNAYIQVLCRSDNVAIESRGSNVGGLVGHMLSGTFVRSFSTAVIKGVDNVGGVVGLYEGGKFAQCYSGGHTTGGQYLPGSENIVGVNNVGGFAGLIPENFVYAGKFTANNMIEDIFQSYSTSSVRGSSCIGGFIGSDAFNTSTTPDKAATTSQCYCTGLVSLNEGGDDRTRGAFAGYTYREGSFSSKNISKVLRYVNGDLRRVGLVGDTGSTNTNNVNENRVHWAYWGACNTNDKNNYIRIDPKSQYDVEPFDPTLDATDDSFPLRTFISYKQSNGKWIGLHYGDWPTVMSSSTVMLNDSIATIEFVDENGNPIGNQFVYTIGGVKPNVKVTVHDALGNPTDLVELGYVKVTYSNNNAVGTGTVMVSGDGTHYGSVITKDFTITPLNISSALVTADPTNFTYDGLAHEPVVTVTFQVGEDIFVIPAEDYEVAFGDCTNAGPVEVTVTPDATKYVVNNESGTLSGEFTIDKAELDASQIKITCSGLADAPVITAAIITADGDVALTDAEFTYDLNADEEKLTVTVDTGNYYTPEPIVLIVHTVTFMIDDTTVYEAHVVLDDELVTLPETDPVVDNKNFLGWVTESNEAFDATVTIKNSAAIFASWEDINTGGDQGGEGGTGGEGGGEQGGGTGGEGGGEQGGTTGGEGGGEQGGTTGGEGGGEQGGATGSEGGGEQGGDTGSGEGGTSTDQQTGGEQGGDSSSSSTDGINDGDYD